MPSTDILHSKEYSSFRTSVALKTVVVETVDGEDKAWRLYDFGPKSISTPLVFLPPASGTADVFFNQIASLGAQGFRVISVEYPCYWTHLEWVEGFRKLLDLLGINKVHIFGASLGAFLAQKFAEYMYKTERVQSLFLCNGFSDTSVFTDMPYAGVYWMVPGFLLKRLLLSNFPEKPVEPLIADSIDFMVDRLESLKQGELASRLTLNCTESYVEPQKLARVVMTIMDVFDECAISNRVKEELYKSYPHAKLAQLKTGGNFPYLSRAEEVTMYIKVHLRHFTGTDVDPCANTLVQTLSLSEQRAKEKEEQEKQRQEELKRVQKQQEQAQEQQKKIKADANKSTSSKGKGKTASEILFQDDEIVDVQSSSSGNILA